MTTFKQEKWLIADKETKVNVSDYKDLYAWMMNPHTIRQNSYARIVLETTVSGSESVVHSTTLVLLRKKEGAKKGETYWVLSESLSPWEL